MLHEDIKNEKDELNKSFAYELVALKIGEKLDEQKNANNPSAPRRWVWELLQNAKDVCRDNKQISVEINFDKSSELSSLTFKHNGKPFSFKDIYYLINQTSTKGLSDDEQTKTTGKFGTGFLTTHLLSEKVKIKGIVKIHSKKEPSNLPFEIPLDRSGKSKKEILEAVIHANTVLDDCLCNKKEVDFNTSFFYELDEKGIVVAQSGIDDLHISLPFTLAFLPQIKSVKIISNNQTITYECLAKEIFLDEETQIIKIKKTIDNSVEDIQIILSSDSTVSIAIGTEYKEGQFFLKEFNSKTPLLFCDFPLVGTHDFQTPIVINSTRFKPNEPRNGVFLSDQDSNDVFENKKIVKSAIDLYLKLVRYASDNNWQNIYLLANVQQPKNKEDWLSESWFQKNILNFIRKELLELPIVDISNNSERLAIDVDNKQIYFPHHSDSEIREKMWMLFESVPPILLPIKEHIHQWYKIIWNKKYYLTLECISNWIEEKKSIPVLSGFLSKNEENTIDWLNQYYTIINLDENTLFNRAILPNQHGEFKARGVLYFDNEIDNELKNALTFLGDDWRNILLHCGIKNGENILPRKKNQEDIITHINNLLEKQDTELDKKEKTTNYLISLFASDPKFSPKREKIYGFSKAMFPNEIEEKRTISKWSEQIWKEADKLQIDRIIKRVAEQKNVKNLAKFLSFQEQTTLEWLNELICFLVEHDDSRLNLKTSPILPNQHGNFKTKDDLSVDGGIDDELKNTLTFLGDDWRNILLHCGIKNGENILPHKRNQEDIIAKINPLLDNENIALDKREKAINYLISLFASDPKFSLKFSLKREKIYSFSKAMLPNEIEEKRTIAKWTEQLWEKADDLQIKRIIKKVAGQKNVKNLAKLLSVQEQNALEWLNELICFLVEHDDSRLNLKTSPILPNQHGVFKTKDDLFVDGGIDDELKDISSELRSDFREFLLNSDIRLELSKEKTKTPKDIADKIIEQLKPKLDELNNRSEETKKICNRLILWFDNHSELAKKIFGGLYEAKYRLYDDKEIAENMRQLETTKEENTLLKNQNEEQKEKIEKQETEIEELKEELARYRAEKSNSNQPKEITQEILISLGITSEEELDNAIALGQLGSYFYNSSDGNFFSKLQYVREIIERAKTDVKKHLESLSNYDCSQWYETGNHNGTVIGGVKKHKEPIKLVIRPSDGGKVIFYHADEIDTLEEVTAELWVGNTYEVKQITLGKVLKDNGIKKIIV